MGKDSAKVYRINEILQETICTIEKSKEEILEIVEHARFECMEIEEELEELREKIDETIKEVDLLEVEERRGRAYLSTVSKNFNIYTEKDIRAAYDKANELRIMLVLKREEEKNLIERRNNKELKLKSAIEVYRKAERVAKSVSVATGYLKGNLGEIIYTVEDLNKRQFLGIKIIEAQEEERQKLARDIHDGPAQSMANMLIKSEVCEKLMDIDEKRSKEELQNFRNIVRETLKDIRKIIYDLRPMSLDDLGLIPTLERYIYNFIENTGIEVELNVIGFVGKLESAIEIAIFRIVQESLHNIAKHSKGTFAKVNIEYSPTRINLSIVDDGIGFNIEKINEVSNTTTGGFGLMNIRERVELLDGTLQINSSPGKGTKLSLYIPLVKEEY